MTAALHLVVTEARLVAEEIRGFRLASADGAPLPGFAPGAHVVVRGCRMDGMPASRAYSLVGDPADRATYGIAVLRQGAHGVSAWLHALAPGTRLRVEPPRNDFALAMDATEHLLIAGGIGITPILAMTRHLAAGDAHFAVHYAGRTPARMAFCEDLRAIAGPRLATWIGSAGGRLDLSAAIGDWRPGRQIYVCGPLGMIEATRSAARARGWPSAALHAEAFGAAPATGRGFTVELARSGKTVTVAPGQSILDRLFAVGVMPSFDCRRGACGACLTRVVAGQPDHHDTCLTAEERAAGEFMTVCVSRSKGGHLVLDL